MQEGSVYKSKIKITQKKITEMHDKSTDVNRYMMS